MSNIERKRGSITIETFLRIAHGLGMQPSQLAVFLDGTVPVSALRGSVGVAVEPGLSGDDVQHVTREARAIEAKRGIRGAKAGCSDAKVATPKKNSNR